MRLKGKRQCASHCRESYHSRRIRRIENFWKINCIEENRGSPDGSLKKWTELNVHGDNGSNGRSRLRNVIS